MSAFLENSGARFTFSEKKLLAQFINDICIKKKINPANLFRDRSLVKALRRHCDPVQKGKKVFEIIRAIRYPLSGGKTEIFPAERTANVANLDSKERCVNQYYYGEGAFGLGEYVVSFISECPLGCDYCFLNEIYKKNIRKIPPDFNRIKTEIADIRRIAKGPVYLNAGENADSLILDAKYHIAQNLWNIIAPMENVFLELRTKTDLIQNLSAVKEHQKRIIPSFSLSPEKDRKIFEKNTAPMNKRLAAMEKLQSLGFPIGIRLEPIIFSDNYEEKYRELLGNVFRAIPPSGIHSLSLGCMRLTKGLVKTLKISHPAAMAEELVLGSDGKTRYCRELRVEIYRRIIGLLLDFCPEEKIVLSAEPPEVWRSAGVKLKTMPEISNR